MWIILTFSCVSLTYGPGFAESLLGIFAPWASSTCLNRSLNSLTQNSTSPHSSANYIFPPTCLEHSQVGVVYLWHHWDCSRMKISCDTAVIYMRLFLTLLSVYPMTKKNSWHSSQHQLARLEERPASWGLIHSYINLLLFIVPFIALGYCKGAEIN